MLCYVCMQNKKKISLLFLYHIGQEEYCILSYCFVFSFLTVIFTTARCCFSAVDRRLACRFRIFGLETLGLQFSSVLFF